MRSALPLGCLLLSTLLLTHSGSVAQLAGGDDGSYANFKKREADGRARVEREGALFDNRPWIDAIVRARDHPLAKSSATAAQWHSLGPWHAPNGIGRINCVAFHPIDTSIIFAGARTGASGRQPMADCIGLPLPTTSPRSA